MSQAQLLPSDHFSPSVTLHKGRPATTSLEVAKFFGKRHDNVVRDIKQIMDNCPKELCALNFEETSNVIEMPNGGIRTEVVIILHRDGFMLLVMGYTGKKAMQIKIAYIQAFNAMEEQLLGRALPSPLTPSTPDSRRPLEKLVKVWASQAHMPHAQAWTQVNAHFTLNGIADLPTEWIPDAIAFVEGKIDGLQKVLPEMDKATHLVPRKSGGKTCTEDALHRLLLETNSLDSTRYKFDDWFQKLSLITGPMYLRAIEAMRTTGNDVLTDNLIGTLHSQAWYAKEKIRDASQAARDACRTAMVVARMMGE